MSNIIRRLEVQNVKRIREAEVLPDGSVVTVSGLNGQGKQQPVSEPVLTPTGWRAIGDLTVGDFVIGADGEATKVVAVHPQECREVWRLTTSDGASVRCGPEHRWQVRRQNGERQTVVMTTADLLASGLDINKGASRKWALPVVEPVQMDSGDALLVDSYTLGVILGDGCSDRGRMQLTTDIEILRRVAPDANVRVHGSPGIGIVSTTRWREPIRALGLEGVKSSDKFVPAEYLRASLDDRRALLAGLLDTDGHPEQSSGVEFSTTSPHLLAAVVELTRSLGGTANVSGPRVTSYTGSTGEKLRGQPSWRAHVKTPFNPFALSRKAVLWTRPEGRSGIRRLISSIVPDAMEDSVCIEVAAPDGLYVTSGYVVTHNSSLIDAVWLALTGKVASKDNPAPLRDGADEGHVTVELDSPDGPLVVTRRWRRNAAGVVSTTLTVANGSGAQYSSPQTMLDGMLGSLSFDPLAFTRLTPREQVRLFLKAADPEFDMDKVDADYKRAYDERRHAGRTEREQTAQLAGMPPLDEDAPLSEVDSAEVLAAIDAAQATVRANQQVRDRRNEAAAREDQLSHQVDRLRAQLTAAEADLLHAQGAATEARAAADALPDEPDVEEFTTRMAELEQINATVRANAERRRAEDRLALLHETVEEYTHQLHDIDRLRADVVARADFGVDGLAVTSEGVLLDGQPFSQASSAEQLRVAMAVSLRLNDGLRIVRITDGSLLDDESLAVVAQMAEAADAQVWIEIVRPDNVGVHIEDGVVTSVNGDPA